MEQLEDRRLHVVTDPNAFSLATQAEFGGWALWCIKVEQVQGKAKMARTYVVNIAEVVTYLRHRISHLDL